MSMLDPRVLAVILALDAAAVASKLVDLWQWHVNAKPRPVTVPVHLSVDGRRRVDESVLRVRRTD